MKTYRYTKILGIFIGILTLLLALGFGYLLLVGMGLSQAFASGIDHATTQLFLIALIFLLLFGGISCFGPFWLQNKGWRQFYIFYSIALGICFLGVYFQTKGALGNLFEAGILGMGILYLLQGTLVITKK
ncbi:hypothetical protein SAMN05877753_106191 [Bacillus oleivorans]|uniref:Uncharacterized protein n=1 Tax=Bacillus oleivorans TaxID=1448271 RepID=A0A285D0C2_9BACI|nr:hypothetical protein [Bacillus oleivorans]SNX72746.1 hypothetical protein SAMN05877753_106191 [Bacillus oleivorans]